MQSFIHALCDQFLHDMIIVVDRVLWSMPAGVGGDEVVLADEELHVVLIAAVLKIVASVKFAFCLLPMIFSRLNPSIDLGQFSRAPANIFHRWGTKAARMLKNLRGIRSRRFHGCIVEISQPEGKLEFCMREDFPLHFFTACSPRG
jgi:hypothetical protein